MSSPLKQSPEAKRTVRTFAFASFLHDAGADMIFSVWPLFLSEILGANMAIIGLIDGLGDAVVSISQAVSGYLSDRLKKRKVFVWLGYFFGGIAKIGYALAPTWHWIIPFRILDRSGKMRGAPRDAIIAEVSTNENRGRNFGFLRMMDNAGAVVGILISIVLLSRIGYRHILWISAIPSMLAVLLVLIFAVEKKADHVKIFKGLQLKEISGSLKIYFLLSAVFSLAMFSYSFLLIFAKKAGFLNWQIPVLYLLFTVIATLFSMPFGRLADAIGRKRVMLFALALWAAVSLTAIFLNSPAGVIAMFALYGLHSAALDPVQRAFVSELAPREHLASTLGVYQMVIGLLSLPASLVAGLLWDRVGLTAPFILSLILTGIAAALLLFVRETRRGLES